MKKHKTFLLVTGYWLLVTFFFGCATIPETGGLTTYYISGQAYYPLVTLCQLRDIDLQYDTLTRVATLNKDGKRVILRPGDALLLVDDNPVHLKYPVDIYQGTMMVPRQFKEQIVDVLFKSEEVTYRPSGTTKLRKVVIDAGHGGNDPGAIGISGLKEKDVNLDIAKRLNTLLRQEGVATVLTRSSDRFIPLGGRVNIANRSQADLFVSIHSNASRTRSLKGFEVYYVSPSVSDLRRAALSSRGGNLKLKNSQFYSNSQELKTIVWDMIYTNSRAESIELSNILCGIMDRNLDTRILGAKSARFAVLRGVTMPGVLVETGFLSNAQEERLLRSSAYRQKLAESILEGIRNYSQGMALVEVAGR